METENRDRNHIESIVSFRNPEFIILSQFLLRTSSSFSSYLFTCYDSTKFPTFIMNHRNFEKRVTSHEINNFQSSKFSFRFRKRGLGGRRVVRFRGNINELKN